MEIASNADIPRRPPEAPHAKPEALKLAPIPVAISHEHRLPIPGSLITREDKGRLLEVLVLGEAFQYAGERFKAPSSAAKPKMAKKGHSR